MGMPTGRRSVLGASSVGVLLMAACAMAAQGAVTSSGDVSPADPTTWNANTNVVVGSTTVGTVAIDGGSLVNSGVLTLGQQASAVSTLTVDGPGSMLKASYVFPGYFGTGTLDITNGGAVVSSNVELGVNSGATGVVTVDGSGSTWTSSSYLNVGNFGSGTLNITNGSAVAIAEATHLGLRPGSSGAVNFGASGGTLTTQSLYGSASQFTGTGAVSTRGLVTDGDLVFDASHGLVQALTWSGLGRNVTVNLDFSASNHGDLGVGCQGAGTLTVTGGQSVTSSHGYLGYQAGSQGQASITGAGSRWTNSSTLYVGSSGSGILGITDGGKVSNTNGYVAYSSGSTGAATVDGAGSTWTCSNSLYVGYSGSGTLNVSNGGKFTASTISIGNAASLLAMSVGDDSAVSLGTGSFTNNGKVLLKAAPVAVAGQTYTPIVAGSWAGTGTLQTLGGTWDAATHTFTASAVTAGAAGGGVSTDRAVSQRMLISDGGTGREVLASFLPAASSSSLTLTAMTLTADQEAGLEAAVGSGEAVLAGWTFAATGYTAGDPVYLSLEIGAGHPAGELEVWHYDGTAWTAYGAGDLSYDGDFASFTVTGFSGYAVTVAPEPGSLGLLGVGVLMLWRRRGGAR